MADPVGSPTTTSGELAPWAADYTTGILSKGEALADQPYQGYSGPLTAGQSELQTKAFSGLNSLNVPTEQMGAFTPTSFTSGTTAQDFMSPYISAALEPQMAEAARQAEIQRVQNAGRLGRAGAYGGGRQAIMESEGQRNLLRNLADIYGTGMQTAYTQGMGQFNIEQDRARGAQTDINQYGLTALKAIQDAGATQRGIEGEGIAADYAQFKEERDDPYKKLQFQKSLLEGMPISAQAYSYLEPSDLSNMMGIFGLFSEIYNKYPDIFGGSATPAP